MSESDLSPGTGPSGTEILDESSSISQPPDLKLMHTTDDDTTNCSNSPRGRNVVLIDGLMLRVVGKAVAPQLVDVRAPSEDQRRRWNSAAPEQRASMAADVRFQNQEIVNRLSDAVICDVRAQRGEPIPSEDELINMFENADPELPTLEVGLMANNRSLVAMMIALGACGMSSLPVSPTRDDAVATGSTPFERTRLTSFLMTRVAYHLTDPTIGSIYVVTDDITAAKNTLAGILAFHDSEKCPNVNFFRLDVDRTGEFQGHAITSAPFNPDIRRNTEYLIGDDRLPGENPPEHFHDNQKAAYPSAAAAFCNAVSLPPQHGRVIQVGVHGLFFRTDYNRPSRRTINDAGRGQSVSGSSLKIPASVVSQ